MLIFTDDNRAVERVSCAHDAQDLRMRRGGRSARRVTGLGSFR
jgi:hypothetical protein